MTDISVILEDHFFVLSHVKKVEEDSGPFDVLEELDTETFSLRCTRDKPWDILEDETLPFVIHYSEIRDESREWIVGDLWSDIGHTLDKCGLPGIWESDDTDIGHEFELKFDISFFSNISHLSEIRRLSRTRWEMGIPESSPTSLTNREYLSFSAQICDNLTSIRISYNRTDRNINYEIFPIGPMHFFDSSFFAILGTEYSCMTEIRECIHIGCRTQVYIPPISPISSIRTTIGYTLLTSPCHHSVPSFSGFEYYTCFIDKHKSCAVFEIKFNFVDCTEKSFFTKRFVNFKKNIYYAHHFLQNYFLNYYFMAKGKRTYMSCISTESGIMGYITNVQKKNFAPGVKLELRKYDKKLRKHVMFKLKETKH